MSTGEMRTTPVESAEAAGPSTDAFDRLGSDPRGRDASARTALVSRHPAVQEFWQELRRTTQARIGLGRTGDALPTVRVLEFRAAHSAARDAVHTPLDVPALAERIAAVGTGAPVHVRSRARDRAEYLRRPDLGRLPESDPHSGLTVDRNSGATKGLTAVANGGAVEGFGVGADGGVAERCAAVATGGATEGLGVGADGGVAEGLATVANGGVTKGDKTIANGDVAEGLTAVTHSGADIGFVLADGLSPRALTAHGPALLAALVDELAPMYSIAPPVIATQARVALGDHIAEAMGVATVVVLIGERPGLSVADSLGVYLTHHPRPGRTDADRNCVSNIHPPAGLDYVGAAKVVAGLVSGAHAFGRSGVDLKDTSRADALSTSHVLSITPAQSDR